MRGHNPISNRFAMTLSYLLVLLAGCANELNLTNPKVTNTQGKLDVSSSEIVYNGVCPVDITCLGEGVSPPVEWKGAPPETKSFAISLWRLNRRLDGGPPSTNSYWMLYNIPADVTSLPKNVKDVGEVGFSDKSKEYLPLLSKEQIVEYYYLTVFALSKELKLDAKKANRQELLNAIQDCTLAEGTLKFQFKQVGKPKKRK